MLFPLLVEPKSWFIIEHNQFICKMSLSQFHGDQIKFVRRLLRIKNEFYIRWKFLLIDALLNSVNFAFINDETQWKVKTRKNKETKSRLKTSAKKEQSNVIQYANQSDEMIYFHLSLFYSNVFVKAFLRNFKQKISVVELERAFWTSIEHFCLCTITTKHLWTMLKDRK